MSYQPAANFTAYSGSTPGAILTNAGLTDPEGARNVARKILETYDRDRNGHIDSI